ncbi:putative microtubule-associated protein [Helianthus debilis subsp. tardiflorus]
MEEVSGNDEDYSGGNVWLPVAETTPLTMSGLFKDGARVSGAKTTSADQELSEAQAEIKALRLFERLREKDVEEVKTNSLLSPDCRGLVHFFYYRCGPQTADVLPLKKQTAP